MRRVLSIVAIVVSLYALLVIFDCIRLYSAEVDTKPVVSLSFGETITEERTVHSYMGLGYKVTYSIISTEDGKVSYDAEFKLFNKFKLWSWN